MNIENVKQTAKYGILHDYDLMANREPSANKVTCAICGKSPVTFQWSDFSGEAMCSRCGCPYQLKWGSDAQEKEGKYPYLNLSENFLPIAQEYWNKYNKFVCYGRMLDARPGWKEMLNWLKENYPEYETI